MLRSLPRRLLVGLVEQSLELLIDLINFVFQLALMVVESLHLSIHSFRMLLLGCKFLPCAFDDRTTFYNRLLLGVRKLYVQLHLSLTCKLHRLF